MPNPEIDVVMPVYNDWDEAVRSLDRLARSEYADRTVTVVDDCGSQARPALDESLVRVIRLKKNSGPAAARNAGARAGTGEIIVFVDSDVHVHPDTLGKVATGFARHPEAACIVGTPDMTNGYDDLPTRHFLGRVHHNYLNLPDTISHTTGSFVAVRRATFEAVGGFNERLTTPGIEDDEFGLDIVQHGGVILHDKTLLVTHEKHIDLPGLLRNDVARTLDRVFYMLRRGLLGRTLKEKRFISSPMSQIASALIAPLPFGLWLLAPLHWLFAAGGLASLLLLARLNRGYLRLFRSHYGTLETGKVFALLLLDMLVVHWALWKGMYLYAKGERYR